MKKYIAALTLIAAGTTLANAENVLTQYATMSDLVSKAATITATNVSANYANSVTAYAFAAGTNSFLNITDTDLYSYVTGGTGYLTVAAWIKADSVTENSVFSFGGQGDGVKFALKDGKMQFTTKNVADKNTNSASITAGDWTLVAWALDLSKSTNSQVYVGNSTTTINVGTWNAANPQTFAIGSGNSGNLRDGYLGEIANLTVFKSDSLADASEVVAKMGSAPVLVPEPSMFGLLAGIGALALVGARRRRSR
ncbi:MAG: LamG domain-containing protein [Opitutales bacterium]|nr:LamG domain-containing protein [Opitutales bacterium]